MQNKLVDLNNYLFEELERLNNESVTEDEMQKEIERSKAITSISQTIINNAELVFKAQKHYDEYGIEYKKENLLLESDKDEK